MPTTEDLLQRWTGAGVLDAATAERIRHYEAAEEHPAGMRWQVALALAFGGILLAAGISLFVAAHWDELAPLARFAVVLGMVTVLHVAAILVRDRFEKLAITLHGVGTMAAGAAVFLVGQIFNMQEHWPAGILLWALCALGGWALLGDQVQQSIAMLLLPAWILCEWGTRTDGYRGDSVFAMRMLVMFATLYLTAFIGSKKRLVFGMLFAASAIALTISIVVLADSGSSWRGWEADGKMPLLLTVIGWCCIIVVPLLAAWRLKASAIVPLAAVLLTALVLPHLFFMRENYGYQRPDMNVFGYFWVGVLACFFAWWGVRERSRALINYGIFAFAATVLWFYFSSVMDKLNRSFSLIFLGLIFLGGGWLLEKMRRQLLRQVKEAA